MFCPNCGAQLPEGAAFCMSCGCKIPAADAVSQSFSDIKPAEQPVFETQPAASYVPYEQSSPAPVSSRSAEKPAKIKRTNIAMGIIVSLLFIIIGIITIGSALVSSGAALSWVYIICYFSIAILVFIARGKLVLFPMGIITVLDLFSWLGSFRRIGNIGGALNTISGFFGISALILMTLMCVYLLSGKPVVPSKGFLKVVPFICQLNAFIFRVLWYMTALGANIPFMGLIRPLRTPMLFILVALFVPLWIRRPQKKA